MCLDFFPGCSSSGHRCSHNATILTCDCTMRLSRTWSSGVGLFYRPLLKAATHHRHTVLNMCSNPSLCPSSFPLAYNATSCSNCWSCSTEVILVGGAWMYPRVNVANTVHLWKHHSYCLQSQNRGCKDRPPEHHLITNDHYKWITNTTTPQYAHIIPWCQWTQSLRCCIFFQQCSLRNTDLFVNCCGASGSMRACHAAGPGSIPSQDKFPGWGFFGVFPHL